MSSKRKRESRRDKNAVGHASSELNEEDLTAMLFGDVEGTSVGPAALGEMQDAWSDSAQDGDLIGDRSSSSDEDEEESGDLPVVTLDSFFIFFF